LENQDLINLENRVESLTNILNGYNIDSRIYSIYTRNGDLDKEIRDFLYQMSYLRYWINIYQLIGDNFIHLILFPFGITSLVYTQSQTLDEELDEIEGRLRIEMLEDGFKYHLSSKTLKGLEKSMLALNYFQI